jgi:SAM-dependent methyltransferase
MSGEIIGLDAWLDTAPGRYLLEWEQRQCDAMVADVFGYHALQLGLPQLEALRANRMPHRWLATDGRHATRQGAVVADAAALPFAAASIDLIALPHTLEVSADPHAALREAERVLVPEGRLVICGLNPASLWGLRQKRGHALRRIGLGRLFLPQAGDFIGYWRLRDWLRLLSFEVESSRFGCYRPALRGEDWLRRFSWMDRVGQRWWPIFGAAYAVVAVKRVRGVRLLGASWRPATALAGAPVSVANRSAQERSQR